MSALLFRWRKLLLSDDGPTLVRRHVLNVLSSYGDENGSDIYPSTRELARATGANRRTVMRQLAEAEEEGWIRRHEVGTDRGKGWKRHVYELCIPSEAVTESHHVGGDRESPRPAQGGDSHDEGGDSHDTKVVTESHLTSPYTSPKTSPSPPEGAEPEPDGEAEAVEEGEPTTATTDGMTAGDLVAAWIGRLDTRPPSAAIPKQGAAAKRLVDAYSADDLTAALDGIGRLYPHSKGEPWDLFDLERKMAKALAAPTSNGRSGRPTEIDHDDLDGWNNR